MLPTPPRARLAPLFLATLVALSGAALIPTATASGSTFCSSATPLGAVNGGSLGWGESDWYQTSTGGNLVAHAVGGGIVVGIYQNCGFLSWGGSVPADGGTYQVRVWVPEQPTLDSVAYVIALEPTAPGVPQVPPTVGPIPVDVPAEGAGETVPGLILPADCTLSVCSEATTVPGLTTPVLSQECTPANIVCVGPVGGLPLTPPVTLPPVCAAAAPLCFGPTPLTPAITVSVSSTGFAGSVEPNVGIFGTIGPIPLQVGPVPVVVCASGCPVPVAPGASGSGSITVTLAVGSQTYSETIPVSV